MRRYFFHFRKGDELIEDEEGTELTSLAEARDNALEDLRQFVGNAIKDGVDVPAELMIVVDDAGRRVAAVPIVAVLPQSVLDALHPLPALAPDRSEEYRKCAQECRENAEHSANAADSAAWLKLANSWLRMLPKTASAEALPEGWPKPTDEDLQASH